MVSTVGVLTLSDRIDAAIRYRFLAHRFPCVKWMGQGPNTTRRTGPTDTEVQTLLIRPLTQGFTDANTTQCGGRKQDRELWTWIAVAHFHGQVCLEAFEEELTDNPITIVRDGVNLFRQINISLLDATYEHPVEKQSSHGTRVTYRFQADLSPI